MLPCCVAVATVMQILPLAIEIDPTVVPVGVRLPHLYHLVILVTTTDGDSFKFNLRMSPVTDPAGLAHEVRSGFHNDSKWVTVRDGDVTPLLAWKSLRPSKFTVECNGPAPTVRWVPRP